jgi:hypothetical protein
MPHIQALGQFIAGYPLALLACVATYMVLGTVWYSVLFQKPWMKMTNPRPIAKKDMGKAMIPGLIASLITGFVQATVLGRGMQILAITHWSHPLIIATILWLPFTFLVLAQNNAYTQKPFALTLIDAGYMLVGMWAMSLILYGMVL